MDDEIISVPTVWDAPVFFENPLRRSGRKINKDRYLQDVEGTYHAIGGFQRLVHTANENPRWFYNRYLQPGTLLAQDRQEVDLTVHIHPALQRSALDVPYKDVTDGELDQGGDQTSGGATSSSGGSRGGEDPSRQDGTGRALQLTADKANGGTRAYAEEDASLIEAMRSK